MIDATSTAWGRAVPPFKHQSEKIPRTRHEARHSPRAPTGLTMRFTFPAKYRLSRSSGMFKHPGRVLKLLGSLAVVSGTGIRAAEVVPPALVQSSLNVGHITREAMHLLKGECFSCHNEKKKKGGLVMTSRESLLQGSESGPVVQPGRQESSLMAKVLLADSDPHMPPKRQLTDPQI